MLSFFRHMVGRFVHGRCRRFGVGDAGDHDSAKRSAPKQY
jgi:hypothetical protein